MVGACRGWSDRKRDCLPTGNGRLPTHRVPPHKGRIADQYRRPPQAGRILIFVHPDIPRKL